MVGQNKLGEGQGRPIRPPVGSRQLQETVLTRTQALAQFVLGLGCASASTTSPRRVPGGGINPGVGGTTMARRSSYLWLFNVSGGLREDEPGESEYSKGALNVNPELRRAHVEAPTRLPGVAGNQLTRHR